MATLSEYLQVKINKETRAELVKRAEKENRSLSQIVRLILENEFKSRRLPA